MTTAAALEALGYGCRDGGLVFSLSAHLWSAVVPIWQHGTTEQQRRYLPALCRGDSIGLHAMTEPDSGSDALALATKATPDGDGFVLRGTKTFITNAPIADLFIVFARAPGSTGPKGVTAFGVESGAPGLSIGPGHDKLGLRTSPMAELILDDVHVDADAIVGRQGRGALVFGTSMAWERTLIMAGALGATYRALDDAVEYAKARQQFGQPIRSFQAVADKLVDARMQLDGARALLYESAWRHDHGTHDGATAAATKLAASEAVVAASLLILQVHGGSGFTRDQSIERHLRDVLGSRVYSGTSDMMRRIVARSMGL
ncbi:MAG: L-prolyl-PCP dehydrogenase [Pseudonocardiales bacterium]|nr:L-prolyl-PCP dehydrogenase [Pseudonocardiales bacterium]